MNMTGHFHSYVYQVFTWGMDVVDADFAVTMKYATQPHQIAISSKWAETIARALINGVRAAEGLQIIFVTLAAFDVAITKRGTAIWTYRDNDTGLCVAIHETELMQ